jgi:hypothetical protein
MMLSKFSFSASSTLSYRKGGITHNVLGSVGMDGRFNYTLAGWEGSAYDGRVLRDAMSKDFIIPNGKWFLADAGMHLQNSN